MSELASKTCVPCMGGVPPLKGEELWSLQKHVPEWKVINDHHLQRTYLFPDFKAALDWVNRIAAVAEEAGHHPNLCFTWGKVEVSIWTHKIDGLVEADFILAAKIDELRS